MIRTGEEYIDSIRDGRQVWINGERVDDVPTHPAFKPLVDVRARIYDMAHENRYREVMPYVEEETGERNAVALKLPHTKQDWLDKYYSVNENWLADGRRKLLALARELLNNDYASHKLTFALFAQSPPFAHLNAVYNNFDFSGRLEFVKHAAGLSDRVMGEKKKEKAA